MRAFAQATRLALFIGMILASAAVMPAKGGADDPPRKVAFGYRVEPDPSEASKKLSTLYLRPNVAHAVTFTLFNEDNDRLNKGVVKLVHVEGKRITTLAQGNVTGVGAKTNTPLVFAKLEDKNKKKQGDIELAGPRHTLQLWLEEEGRDPAKHDLDLRFSHPNRYVDAKGTYDRDKKRLYFDVAMKPDVIGPMECEVELELDPLFFPGLQAQPIGVLQRKLTTPGADVKLFVDTVDFAGFKGQPLNARIFLTVDGFKRAFEFLATFPGGGNLEKKTYNDDVAIHFQMPRFVLAGKPKIKEKDKVPDVPEITLAIDGQIDQMARVEYAWDPTGTKDIDQFQAQEKKGLRDLRVEISTGMDGEVIFKTTARDWRIPLMSTGVQQVPAWLRVGVLKGLQGPAREKVRDDALLPLKFAGNPRISPLTLIEDYVYAAVTPDATPPENVRFVGLSGTSLPGKPLVVQAACSARDEERQAPIDRVFFFYGEPQNGKLPKDAKEGQRAAGSNNLWEAILDPQAKPGPQLVSAQFRTAVGLDATVTAPVNFEVATSQSKLTTIKGIAFHVSEDRPLAKLDVFLMDEKLYLANDKMAEKGKVKSDDKGNFEFKEVKPGKYTLAAATSTPKLAGYASVDVPEGKQLIDNVKLKLSAK